MEASYVGKADGKLLMSRINPGVPYNEGRSAAVWDNIDNMKPAPNTSITKPPAPAATTAPTPATSIENQHEKEPR
jgi:hypothetical protein